jgi:hypothetical protein
VKFGFGAPGASGGVNHEALVAAFALRVWNRSAYSGSPWAGTASAGASGSQSLTEATNPPTSSSGPAGNIADFDGTNDKLGTGAATSNIYTTTAQYGWALIKVDAINTNDANFALNDPITMTSGTAQWAVILRDAAGTRTVEHWLFTGAVNRSAVTSISLAAWTLVQWKQNGTTISIRTNSNAWVDNTGGTVNSLAANLEVGNGGAGGQFYDGQIAELGMTEVALTNGNFDTVVAYVNQRYGLSL